MKDMQDIEFTVQDGELFMLQTRNGKRTGHAALNIACDMVSEGLIDEAKAVCMVEPTHLDQLLHPQFEDPKGYKSLVFAQGLAASPGEGNVSWKHVTPLSWLNPCLNRCVLELET